jgi:chemotaxis protein CheZ
MSRISEGDDLQHRLNRLAGTAPPADPAAIAEVVENVLRSLSGGLSVANFKLYRELEELAEFIQSARHEIADIQPQDICERQIPMATDELDAVVGATADATGTILDAAETIERRVGEMQGEAAAAIGDAVTRIYEACNFQDITGQRITKVVSTLKHIETRIGALLATFGADLGASPMRQAVVVPSEDEGLVNGPQLPGKANDQDAIDAILASFD